MLDTTNDSNGMLDLLGFDRKPLSWTVLLKILFVMHKWVSSLKHTCGIQAYVIYNIYVCVGVCVSVYDVGIFFKNNSKHISAFQAQTVCFTVLQYLNY